MGGSADVGFDTSITAANLIPDHSATAYRRIGSFLTDSTTPGNLVAFSQAGDHFIYTAPTIDASVDPDTTATTHTLAAVPPSVPVMANISFVNTGGGSVTHLAFTSMDQSDTAVSLTANLLAQHGVSIPAGAPTSHAGSAWVRTSTSQQIRSRNLADNTDLDISVLGYLDRRGRDD